MRMVGLAFKLSAVPFHFWAPDVFEGCPAEVGTFLSIASKAAALGLLARLALAFSLRPRRRPTAALAPARFFLAALIAPAGRRDLHLRQPGRLRPDEHEAAAGLLDDRPCRLHDDARGRRRGPGRRTRPGRQARAAVAALVVYLGVYLFMNFGAFAFVAFLRNATGSESIADYAGLVRRSPGLAVAMAIILFSLVGLPPLAGFSAKFAAFAALWDARLLALLGHRRPEHGAEPVLLPPRGQGDGAGRRARAATGARHPAASVPGVYVARAGRRRCSSCSSGGAACGTWACGRCGWSWCQLKSYRIDASITHAT